MKLKKLTAVILGITLLSGTTGSSRLFAEPAYTDRYQEYVDNNEVVIYENGCVVKGDTLIDYVGTSPEMIVPDGVRNIAKPEKGWQGVTSLVVPDSVEWIADRAFSYSRLEKVSIPETTVLGTSAFESCYGLLDENHMVIVNGVLFFIDITDKTIIVPEGVTKIDTGTVYIEGGRTFEKLVFPKSLRYICKWAFNGGTYFEIDIPEGLTYIAEEAFVLCGIYRIDLPEGLRYMGKESLGSYINENIRIPDSVEYIGEDAIPGGKYVWMDGEYKMTDLLVFGYKGSSAEEYASKTKDIRFISFRESQTQYPKIREEMNLGDFYVSGSVQDGYQLGGYTGTGAAVTLPEGFPAIKEYAFANPSNQVTSITIPEGYTDIEAGAFSSRSITSVQVPDTLRTIGDAAFKSSRIDTMELPDSVETIGADAFAGCSSLTGITVPEIAQIGTGAFTGCTGLADGEGMVIVNDILFDVVSYDKTRLRLPAVQKIDDKAFSRGNRSKLTDLVVALGTETIGAGAFTDCGNLSYVYLPDSVSLIGAAAFPEQAVLFGTAGSAAEQYAKAYGYTFYPIKDEEKFLKTADLIHEGENQPAHDINGDSTVDLQDAQMILKAALNIEQEDVIHVLKLDSNEDGTVDLADAQLVLKEALNIIG